MRRTLVFTIYLIGCLLFTSSMCFAANKYIRTGATGSNNGADWTNAYPSFASVSGKWTRGNTYYVAGGTYNENVAIALSTGAGSWIKIWRATVADHGSATDWKAGYDAQVIINGTVYLGGTDYIEIDGKVGQGTDEPRFNYVAYGIKVAPTTCTNGAIVAWANSATNGTGPCRLSHLEIKGCGESKTLAYRGIMAGYAGTSLLHIDHNWIHAISLDGVYFGNQVGTNWTDNYGVLFENNILSEIDQYLYKDTQGIMMGYHPGATGNSYVIFRNNIFRNVSSTSFITFGYDGTYYGPIRIYNNIFYDDTNFNTDASAIGVSRTIYGMNNTGTSCSTVEIYNNTFYNLTKGVVGMPSMVNCAGATLTMKNNIFAGGHWRTYNYAPAQANNTNNMYYNNSFANGETLSDLLSKETNSKTESSDPFINSSDTSVNFNLGLKATATNAAGKGADLSSVLGCTNGIDCYDISGNIRTTWDIGAYKCCKPEPPVNLRIK